ncbi:MAG: hypothetical protein CR986_00055 [Ignavibacteriae bacterium]|nr:MAG: hypothetical protein CR986_00055 [Ignavibacteriota bacterium]
MVSFTDFDIAIIVIFLFIVILIGLSASFFSTKNNDEGYLLSDRNVGMSLFILTNVATWYGGILGVGEFSFRYGLVSWLTQGVPYYFFALLFAFFFAGKIREASLYTIPDKLSEVYGKKVGLLSASLIFILVLPAPYLLILSQILIYIFNINSFTALIISSFISSIYLIFGGYKSNIWADSFSFFVMFFGFMLIVYVAFTNYGGLEFLENNLPENHLFITGNTSITYIIVWFLIALWTFTDPGFHQRCYSAKSKIVAKWGIVISVFLWALFDFLTNSTGLYSKAIIPDLQNPMLAFPSLADKILSSGLKGIFFSALLATVLSTLNSFIFLSATTFSRDFVFKLNPKVTIDITYYTRIGIFVALTISIIIAYFFKSVVELWYTIGSICIPGIILLIISAYYPKLRVSNRAALVEIILGVLTSIIWFFIMSYFSDNEILSQIEPMIVGMVVVLITHLLNVKKVNN